MTFNSLKQRCLLLKSPLRMSTVRNGGHYSLSQCDMNSLLAANVKCDNTEVKKWSKSCPYIVMMMLTIKLLYDKSIMSLL